MRQMQWVENCLKRAESTKELALMTPDKIEQVRRFHKSFPQYQPTPLLSLPHMAKHLGVGGLYLKDESHRFGLNAFKVLGGSFAIAQFIAHKTHKSINTLGYRQLQSPALKADLGSYTFFTATDGNHGRGVAWAANQIGQKSKVFMPKGSSPQRLANIRKEGASAEITNLNYDDTVRLAYEESQKTPHGIIIQDTAWEGYEEIPGWIIQGYGTMAMEAGEQLVEQGIGRPTHVILQAGVGSMAGAVQGYFANLFPKTPPVVLVVEASAADCHYRSAQTKDGSRVNVKGNLDTIMAGLACGEANTISWEILKNHASFFVSLSDALAARGMRVLGAPLPGDPRILSGESGASGFGFLFELLHNSQYEDFKKAAKLGPDSNVLLFSTEGDTDPEQYRRIVWDGEYPTVD